MATPKLGTAVTYISSNGKQKAALVIGTSETIEEGTNIDPLTEDQLHLYVLSPNGNTYTRYSVPSEESMKDNEDGEDNEARGVWRA